MDEACISTTFAAVWALSNLDLGAPEARPIVRLLEGMPSALRFALDHPLVHFGAIGLSSASYCAVSPAHTRKPSHSHRLIGVSGGCGQILCALVFGKDEAGGAKFQFTQELVDDIVAARKDFLTGALVSLYPTIPAYDLRSLVHLCISGTACLLDRTAGVPDH